MLSRIIPESVKSRYGAKTMARTSKRLDICAAQIGSLFHLNGGCDLNNKVCLEIGSGWVLSHAMILHLLGAKRVLATDISPIAYPESLRLAVHESIPSIVRDMLAPFDTHEKIRNRLDNLLAIEKFSFDTLADLGIEYTAPVDLARDDFKEHVDFIYSNSVLEHVPTGDVPAVIGKMADILNPSGTMIHSIHLEDHHFIGQKPFAFLSEPDETYPQSVQSARGNRMRKSQWIANFQSVKGLEYKILYEYMRENVEIPEKISPSIGFTDENDLRVTHLGIYIHKN